MDQPFLQVLRVILCDIFALGFAYQLFCISDYNDLKYSLFYHFTRCVRPNSDRFLRLNSAMNPLWTGDIILYNDLQCFPLQR